MTAALFVDRDGTLVIDRPYPREPALVEPLPGACEALIELQRRFALVIVSNQSGLGRGIISVDQAAAVHERVVAVFAEAGVRFTATYYCPHAPDDGCACRKPHPGMLLRAAREHGLELARSVMVGDAPTDVAAGLAAGCRAIMLGGTSDDALCCADWDAVRLELRARV